MSDQPNNGSYEIRISKFLVALLMIAVLAAACIYVWICFRPASKTNKTTDTSTNVESDTASTADTSGASDEINALDKSMAGINDDALLDSEISDSNLGL